MHRQNRLLQNSQMHYIRTSSTDAPAFIHFLTLLTSSFHYVIILNTIFLELNKYHSFAHQSVFMYDLLISH